MIDVKITTRPKSGAAGRTSAGRLYNAGGSISGATDNVPYAREAGHAKTADKATGADTARLAAEADHAASAATLDDDSPVRDQFLHKDREDTAAEKIIFGKGLESGTFSEGKSGGRILPSGAAELEIATIRKSASIPVVNTRNVVMPGFTEGIQGGRIWLDSAGNAHVETDYLDVHRKMSVREIEIREETHAGGCQIISPAAMRCAQVEKTSRGWRCYFHAADSEGTEVSNDFRVGDLARCETWNIIRQSDGTAGNRYYWRRVIDTGTSGTEHWIELSSTHCDPAGTDTPMAGDRIVTMGNDSDPSRQHVIITASYGSGAPYIYQYAGVDTYSLSDDRLKTRLSPNGNRFTGQIVMTVDGQEQLLSERLDAMTPYTLRALPPVVLASAPDGETGEVTFCPSVITCAIYHAEGTKLVRRMPYSGITGGAGAPVTQWGVTVTEGGKLVTDGTAATLPAGLELRQVITSADADGSLTAGTETASSGVVIPVAATRAVEFRLYLDGMLIDSVAVNVQTDPSELDTKFTTLFEMTDRAITAQAAAVNAAERRVSALEITAERMQMAVLVDGQERAGMSLDAEEGITMQADKIRILNGGQLAALFRDGMLNASLIMAEKLMTSHGGTRGITIGEFGDNFIRFYRPDGMTLAMKIGLESVSLSKGLSVAAADPLTAVLTPDSNLTEVIIQVFNAAGGLTWALTLDGPVTPDTQRYSWQTLSLVRETPSNSTRLRQSRDTLEATEYWMFRDSGTGGEFHTHNRKLFTRRLSDNELRNSADTYKAAEGNYFSPDATLAASLAGSTSNTWERAYYTVGADGVAAGPYKIDIG